MMRNVPEEATDIMLASLSRSTQQQYRSALKPWLEFCTQNHYDVYNPCRYSVIAFLTMKTKNGASYGTINSIRSAISLLSKNKIGDDPEVCRFINGVSKIKPPKPKYNCTWDVTIVLRYMETIDTTKDKSFKLLSYKTVMLLAICSAHRVQTFANIKVENIKETPEGFMIHVPDKIKTSAPGRCQPLIYLPYYRDNGKLCAASTLKQYLEVANKIRHQSADTLFISIRKPYKKVGTQSLSRWLKTVMSDSGVDTSMFTAHSTRHASTSAALADGVDIETIRKAAGWSPSSETFARFYNRPIVAMDNNDLALAVLNRAGVLNKTK